MIELKRILAPTDFSESAQVAMRYARALAEAFNAALHVLHVVKDPLVHAWTSVDYNPDLPSTHGAASRARVRPTAKFLEE